MPKLLLVEDDPNLAHVIKDNLEEAGYEVILASDGEIGWSTYLSQTFDLCLLDVMLPKKDGFSLAKNIRATDTNTPILFITAKSLQQDKLQGFFLGGDDYITKPFSMEELIMRIEVFLRRSKPLQPVNSKIQLGDFIFDYQNMLLQSKKETHSLTQKEADILKYFCQNVGVVLKREQLLKQVWGDDDYFLGRSMDVFISKLRKYLKNDPAIKINNLHGVGFQLIVE